ncbi:unnamed protein product [Mytilus coruscus]|uniref:Uncharacterized protein n=1 Tax=Mytilus coruscus TaxID=42192 RepID=A0A6J8AYX5_MYTCO|nr:unnamed protein product [Mytilus coruscus]
MYDPLGFLGPLTVRKKLLIQNLQKTITTVTKCKPATYFNHAAISSMTFRMLLPTHRFHVIISHDMTTETTIKWHYIFVDISSSKSFVKFANNCTKEIKEATRNSEWKYVPTESNPALFKLGDISATQFKESTLWMRSPGWISDEDNWLTWTKQPKQETTLMTTTGDNDNTETFG